MNVFEDDEEPHDRVADAVFELIVHASRDGENVWKQMWLKLTPSEVRNVIEDPDAYTKMIESLAPRIHDQLESIVDKIEYV